MVQRNVEQPCGNSPHFLIRGTFIGGRGFCSSIVFSWTPASVRLFGSSASRMEVACRVNSRMVDVLLASVQAHKTKATKKEDTPR